MSSSIVPEGNGISRSPKVISEITEPLLDTTIAVVNTVRKKAFKDSEWGLDDSFELFIKKMLLLTPQSYGSRIQNYMARRFNLTRVDQKLDKGDFVNSMNQHYEVKVSLITETNIKLNMVQIRPWQEISGYYCIAVDTRVSPFRTYAFHLSKNEMEQECNKHASSAHGTKSAVASNPNRELRLDLPIKEGDKRFQEWCKKYLQNDIALQHQPK